jgi:hypothetical protein
MPPQLSNNFRRVDENVDAYASAAPAKTMQMLKAPGICIHFMSSRACSPPIAGRTRLEQRPLAVGRR